jgi:hypothetical protein
MPAKKFKAIEILTDNPSEIFFSHRVEISKAIISAIEFGVKYKRKKIDFAHIVIKDKLVITLSIDSREFVDLIEQNLQTLIDEEEYEACAVAVKIKDKLTNKK